jgi:outer membrane protein assembly factor BamA
MPRRNDWSIRASFFRPITVISHVGSKFPTGKLANWSQISMSIEEMQKPLQSQGFLRRRVRPAERIFHEESGTVDLRLRVQKGPQYLLGELKLVGFPASLEPKIRNRWKLQSGAPYDELYGLAFYKSLYELSNGQAIQMKVARESTGHVVDLVFSIKSPG